MDLAIQQGDALRIQFLYTEMWDWPLYLKDLVTELRFSAGDSLLHAVVRKHAEIGKHEGENSFVSRVFVHLLGSSAGAIAGLQPRVWPTPVVSALDAQEETPLHTAVGPQKRSGKGRIGLSRSPWTPRLTHSDESQAVPLCRRAGLGGSPAARLHLRPFANRRSWTAH